MNFLDLKPRGENIRKTFANDLIGRNEDVLQDTTLWLFVCPYVCGGGDAIARGNIRRSEIKCQVKMKYT